MGEAKRRKATDPDYGQPRTDPTLGLVIAPEFSINADGSFNARGHLDAQELRYGLLFWDKLVWANTALVGFPGGPDEKFLQEAGLLERPVFKTNEWSPLIQVTAYIETFRDLDKREPGRWALAQGLTDLLKQQRAIVDGEGVAIELYRAIPVPDKDVPLQEIMEFKFRRRDELRALRSKIDNFVSTVTVAEDKEAAIRTCVAQIDEACAAALKVGREWQFPVRLANLKTSFELSTGSTMAGLGAAGLSILQSLPTTATIVAGLAAAGASTLKVTGDFGWRGLSPRAGPYRYVSQFHREVF